MNINTPFEKFPEFTTERLYLRMVEKSDAPALFEIKSDAELTARYGRRPHTNLEQTSRWVNELLGDYKEHKGLFWCITLKGNNTAIGSFTLWNLDLDSYMAELGYELNRKYWGRGIMNEALSYLVNWAFSTMGLNRMEACPLKKNLPSVKLLEKLGFHFEGNLRERVYFNGEFNDQLYYSILRDEWEKQEN